MRLSSFQVNIAILAIAGYFTILSPWGGVWPWVVLLPGILLLFVIPGWLLARNLRIVTEQPAEMLLYSVGLSLFLLMGLGLLINSLLPYLGIHAPLVSEYIIPGVVALALILQLSTIVRRISLQIVTAQPKYSVGNAVMYMVPIGFTALSILGAFTLNNGGSDFLALCSLFSIGIFVALIIWRRRQTPVALYAYSLYFIALSLLLSVSLRGWVISGHDILSEYHVFQLTYQHHLWSMSFFHDAYNACLSITLLPTMIAATLPIANQDIFRVLFQAMVALTPVGIFIFAGRFLNRHYAFIAAFFFMAQATFLRDYPYLTRQEIAILFFVLMLCVLFSPRLKKSIRHWLFAIFGVAMVWSHYSTTYVAAGLFVGAFLLDWALQQKNFQKFTSFIMRPLVRFKPLAEKYVPSSSEVVVNLANRSRSDKFTSGWLILGLLVATLAWNTVITQTSGNLTSFLTSSAKTPAVKDKPAPSNSIFNQFKLLGAAVDTSQSTVIKDYNANTGYELGDTDPAGVRYNASTYASYNPVRILPQDLPAKLPPGPTNIIYLVGGLVQKIMKLFVLVGAIWIVYELTQNKRLDRHLGILMGASLFTLIAALLLPAIEVNYDLLRAYQQLVIVLCLPAIIGCVVLLNRLPRRLRYTTAGSLFIAYFFFVVPVVPQVIGSGYADLQLNNFGLYYNLYYTHASEIASINWLAANGNHNIPIYADFYATNKLTNFSPRPLWIIANVLPKDITKNGYVYADYTNQTLQTAYVYYDGQELNYNYPTTFLHNNKNVLYTNGSTQVMQ